MTSYRQLALWALSSLTILAAIPALADNMASIAITPATGVVTLVPRWSIGPNLAGFHLMSQDWGLTGGAANEFYSIKNTAIPSGGDTLAYNFYVAGSGAATPHADIGSKLTPDSYSALTSADPDIGYGSVNQYLIHHKGSTDYLTVIKPGAATASSVTDLKPMSGPGGPSTVTSVSGYVGLTFAAANLGYGLNLFYYLRTDPVTQYSKFGSLVPALAGTSTDQFDLGIGGYKALAFTGTDVGYGTDKMYYLRLEPITGYTVLGTLHPVTGRTADIANLGSVFTTLTFVPGDVGFGSGQFYITGAVNPTWQSISFAAIPDRILGAGSFTVKPTASSGLPIDLMAVTGSATISAPVGGVFTVTPTGPGLITLQATQAGQVSPTPYKSNMLRQSFLVSGGSSVDFNLDGYTDIVWQNTATGERAVFLMNSLSLSTAHALSLGNVNTNWSIAAAADFNGDGKTDLLWQNTVTRDYCLFMYNGTTLIATAVLGSVSPNWSFAAAADFNNDGKTDIVFQNTVTGDRCVYLMNTLSFSTATAVMLGNVSTNWSIVAAADFDNDGKADLVWQNTATGDRAIFLMNTLSLSTAHAFSLGNINTNWSIVAARDFNHDGKPDLLWENTANGDRAVFFMNGAAIESAVALGNVSTLWRMR